MNFELRDEDIRKIRNVAMAELRKEFYRWACWALDDGKFKGWAIDMINMGIAVAKSQIHKWDQRHTFTRWACLKICEEATADLRKRTRRKNKQSEVDAAEFMTRSPIDGLEECIQRDTLKGLLKKLSPQMQIVTALYYACGMTDPEIARFLKMKLPTVQSLRSRAKEQARQYYISLHAPKPLKDQTSPAAPRTTRGQRKPRDSTDDEADPQQFHTRA